MLRFAPALPLICSLALVSSAFADPDPRVTTLVLSDRFLVNDGKTKAAAGQVLAERKNFFLSPDGSKLAVIGNNADGTSAVWLEGKAGPAFENISSPQWSTQGSTFVYVGEKKGRQSVVRNNIPGESAVLLKGLKAVDTSVGLKVIYAASQDPLTIEAAKRNWSAIGVTKASEITQPETFFPNADASSVFIGGNTAKGDESWARDDGYYGPATKFGLNRPKPPAWSPDGKHVTFMVDNGPNHNFLVDTQGVFLVSEDTYTAWSPSSDRFIAYSPTSMAVVFKMAASGKAALEYNAKLPLAGRPYWSRNGLHYAFYLPRTGEAIVDGKAKAAKLRFNNVPPEPGTDWDLVAALRSPQVAVSEDGDHWAAVDANPKETGIEIFVRWDGKEGPAVDGIYDLKWGAEDGGPLYLARKVTKDGYQWSLFHGETEFVLASGSKEAVLRPLGHVTLIDGKTARVVLQEGTRVIRYDIRLDP